MGKDIVERIFQRWSQEDRIEKSIIAPVPGLLMLELTNACNLSCSMCYNPRMKRKIGFMSLELARDILDEAREIGMQEIALYSTGESLLHRQFIDIVKLCKERGLRSYVTSNGFPLNRDMCYEICKSGLDSFKFSIDGANKDEYEKIRVGGCFEELKNKVEMLRGVRDEIHSSMRIYASSVRLRFNEKNIEQFKFTYGPYVDSILFSTLTNQGGQMVDEYGDLKGVEIKSDWRPCRQLWDRMVVSYDGKISGCCVDYEMALVYAEFQKTGLRESWNNEIMVKWRQAQLKGGVDKIPLCKDCNSPYFQNIEILNKLNKAYDEAYFKDRHPGSDAKRDASYLQEYARIGRYITKGKVLDIGCGMGNFLQLFDSANWDKYGIEISEYACNLAKEKGIRLIDYNFDSEFFDLVVFRGVLQHLDTPLYSIRQCIRMLKKGGLLVFLATPNTNSIYYRIFRELPMLDPRLNFILPSDTMLKQILANMGVEILELRYPYIDSPYANLVKDHMNFLLRFFGGRKKFPFWGNMMECYARKG